jgi:hypothetical protein
MRLRSFRLFLAAVVLLAAFAALRFSSHGSVRAQTATVDFVLPSPAPVATPNPPGDEGDVAIFTGRPAGTSSAGNCAAAPGSYPVQPLILVDPGTGQTGRATRPSSAVVTSQTDPVHPGTKARNLSILGDCTIDNSTYTRFRGNVE